MDLPIPAYRILWLVESDLAILRGFGDPKITPPSSCDTTNCDEDIHSLSVPRTAWTRDSRKNSMGSEPTDASKNICYNKPRA